MAVNHLSGAFISKGLPHDEFVDDCSQFNVANMVNIVECPKMKCGTTVVKHTREGENASFRFSGGVKSSKLGFPFIVSIYLDGIYICGGSILTPLWVKSYGFCD